MKLLFLQHKTIKPYKNELNDEYHKFSKWLEKLGIPYEFEFKEFDDELEYQSYNNDAFYCLSQDFMKRMSGKYENPGDYHTIYFLHAPTHPQSAGVFTTHYWNDFNGSVCIDMPISEEDAKRPDCWIANAFAHEFIHSCFGILRNAWKINITDYQDQAYQEYCKLHPNPTEEELTALSESIYHTTIEPYKDKLLADVPIKGVAKVMVSIIGILTGIVELLKKKAEAPQTNKKEQVISLLAHTIARQEGFYVNGSRAKKNCNPGNLIYIGQSKAIGKDDKGFAIFANEQDGWDALYWQLNYILDGKSRYYSPEFTLEQFVNVWASTSPINEKEAYAKAIADTFGVSINTKLKDL